jgi:predicted  nucleic acid-binding Zn-ribbon protein
MDNEQVIDTTAQETSVDVSTTVTEETSTQEIETYSKADYDKAVKSAASKAKFDILKELGINSVKEFQELKSTYETAINEKSTLEKSITDLNKKNTTLEEDLLLTKLGVSEEYKKDILTLAKSKVDEGHNLETVSKELLEKYPQWRNVKETIKMGTEKSDFENKPEVSSSLSAKYPWLK